MKFYSNYFLILLIFFLPMVTAVDFKIVLIMDTFGKQTFYLIEN